MKDRMFSDAGKRIKTARKSLKIQQKEMADALGVSPSHLSEIETGKARGSADLLLKISEMYNVSTEYIFHGRGEMFYTACGKVREKPFDFNSDVDNMEDLLWLLENSTYVRLSVMTFVSRLLLVEEAEIKKSLKRTKSK